MVHYPVAFDVAAKNPGFGVGIRLVVQNGLQFHQLLRNLDLLLLILAARHTQNHRQAARSVVLPIGNVATRLQIRNFLLGECLQVQSRGWLGHHRRID